MKIHIFDEGSRKKV